MENILGQKSLIEIKEITANGMKFRCRMCGMENSGEPVILMHGFPESSHMWEPMLVFLASKGYRCLAPDLRSYSAGARPKDIDSYRIDKIASDVIALADAVGFQKIQLVGHDWGAGCGWTIVEKYPDRVNSWSALSIPHMKAFDIAKKEDSEQMGKSWYMSFFQTPFIPELGFGLAVSSYYFAKKLWLYASDGEIREYISIFKEPDAREAIINWYRANKELLITYGNVSIPTLLIWGNKDIAVAKAGIEMTKKYMTNESNYNLIRLDAGHTLVQENFKEVSQAILSHIQKYPIV